MDKHIVALVPVDSYDQDAVDAAVRIGIGLLGGIGQFARPEEKVLLKPNLLSRALPQKAITTHPAVFSAVARLLRESGYTHLSYGDSPGNPTTSPAKAADLSGIAEAAARWNVTPADFDHGSTVAFPEGRAATAFVLCNGVQQCDAMISLCKMKTHALERITGAMKNLYGCIFSANKAMGHTKFPSSELFAEMLCDLHRRVKPRLHIMDGIEAMEGNGPSSGTPVKMNVLLFSADPVALDTVFAYLVHLDPAAVPTCVSGAAHGLGVTDPALITVLTPDGALTPAEAQARYGKPDFDVFRGVMKKSLAGKFLPLLPGLQSRPKVDLSKCVACGVCEESCPVPEKAVRSGHGRKAKYDYSRCIRCFCCQEMCPAKAIEVHRSPLAKLLGN